LDSWKIVLIFAAQQRIVPSFHTQKKQTMTTDEYIKEILYSHTDQFLKNKIMKGKELKYGKLFTIIRNRMHQHETDICIIYFDPADIPFVGMLRPELVKLFEKRGYRIIISEKLNGVFIEPILTPDYLKINR